MTPTREQTAEAATWHIRLQDPSASDAEWNAFSDWLEQTPSHREAYDRVEQAWVLMEPNEQAALGPVPIAEPANDDVSTRGAAALTPLRRRRVWLMPGFAAAAATILAIGLWPAVSGQGGLQTYRTTTEPLTVMLDDGSHIYLNRATDLTVRMGRTRRAVVLADGEAAFDVTHDPSKPFEIQAGPNSVRVLGTAFNVLNHADHFAVGVERGVVSVNPAGDAPDVRLVAGQTIQQTGTAPAVMGHADPGMVSGWRRGVLAYDDRPLSEVAGDISRYFGQPLRLTHDAAMVRFTGTLRMGSEAETISQLTSFLPVERDPTVSDLRLRKRAAH